MSRKDQVRALVDQCEYGLIERRQLLEAILLAAVAREHVLIIGPPGTAKSEAVRRIAAALGGNYFEYLLGKFTEPAELFGPVDLQKLQLGQFETVTNGMLPEAEIAFLDEVFTASTAILNTLLGILNERVFRKGGSLHRCPLKVAVGASNALPEGDYLGAFADRFLIRLFVEPVEDALLELLLENGRQQKLATSSAFQWSEIQRWSELAQEVDLKSVQPALAQAVRELRNAGITLSDRRIVRCQNLVAAAAVLDDRDQAELRDLWTLLLVVPSKAQQQQARTVLANLLKEAKSLGLSALCEDASGSLAARAQRLERVGQEILQRVQASLGETDSEFPKAQALLREIDCAFVPDSLPATLFEVRTNLISLVQSRR